MTSRRPSALTASVLKPKLWGVLAVAPLIDALWPLYVVLGLLEGVKC